MNSIETKIQTHLQHLVGEIGTRPIGSPANQAAGEYIHSVFSGCGLQVEVQQYACPSWEALETALELDGLPLEVAPNAFSPSCDLHVPLVPVGTQAELELADLEGRIALLYGDLTRSPLEAKAWFLKSERGERLVQTLESKHPAAVVAVQPRPGFLDRLVEDAEVLIPSVTVPLQTGLALLRHPSPEVHLRLRTHQEPGRTANLVADRPGRRLEKVVFCAHYDTKIDTPGACDNGGGVALLLTLAQYLSRRAYACGLEFIAFTGEEYLPIGDDTYLERRGKALDSILAAVNFDGAGLVTDVNTIMITAAAAEFQQRVVELAQADPGLAWTDPWPESNHSTFSFRGVPSLAFTCPSATYLTHRRMDTLEWVSPARLASLIPLMEALLLDLEMRPLEWTRPA